MKLEEALITGIFGVVVAVITWILAGYRDAGTYKRDLKKERINKLENLYTQTISQLEQLIRITESGEKYEDIEKSLSDNNAHLRLVSTKSINEKLEEVSELMYRWSSNYRLGAPKRIGDSNAVMISSQDSKYKSEAKNIYPKLNDAIVDLIELMRLHLDEEKKA